MGGNRVVWQSERNGFTQQIKLLNGISSHDTIERLFARIKPKVFEECFIRWVSSLAAVGLGEIISIDGKKLRRSHDKAKGKYAIHIVSAWANANNLVLGQLKVDNKSNEITAIPKLTTSAQIQTADSSP